MKRYEYTITISLDVSERDEHGRFTPHFCCANNIAGDTPSTYGSCGGECDQFFIKILTKMPSRNTLSPDR